MMPRDKLILAVEGVVAVYVLYQVTSTVYNHLKAKDRLKRMSILVCLHSFPYFYLVIKLLYKRQRRLDC